MRRVMFLLLLLVTLYLAGSYQEPALLALCAAQGLLFVLSAVMPHGMRRRLTLSFSQASLPAEKGRETRCALTVVHAGFLPVSALEIRLSLRYPGEKEIARLLRAGVGRGRNRMDFLFLSPCCGIVKIRMETLRVHDYLRLFSSKSRLSQEMEALVFPRERRMSLALVPALPQEVKPCEELAPGTAGEPGQEIRQLRPYRPGDPYRHMHWNLTARTGDFWIREYEREAPAQAELYVQLHGLSRLNQEEKSAFYELLSALLLGLWPACPWSRCAGGKIPPARWR